jgi:molybdate/tungstate transport system substrate-binding protein
VRRVRLLLAALLIAACGGTPTAPVSAPPGSPSNAIASVPAGRTPLIVFAAGSLIVPFQDLETAFEARNPGVDVQAEYHGSIQVIRHVSDLHEQVDVVATADASLVPMLLYSANDAETGRPYADWQIRFASNRLAIAFTRQSRHAAEITADNWYDILSRRDVRVGLSDPRFDALGYRALMLFALANGYYDSPGLFAAMFDGRLAPPVTLFQDEDLATVTVPEVVDTKPETGLLMRGASIQLIALLQSGDIDYAIEYESVIRQHGLQMLSLPDRLNLGAEHVDYGSVQVNLDFQRFARVKPEFRGERIGYGVTIPSNAPHPREAEQFVEFMLGPEGRAIMAGDYHPMFAPVVCEGNIPVGLSARAGCG